MTVNRRNLGADGPSLSQITYGAMRLSPEAVSHTTPADHLCRLHDHGVDTHHSSHEYDSHPVYLDALRAARRTGRRFHHIVKLSEPSFDSDRFDGRRLTALLDNELSSLEADTIASVQWLFRTPNAQDSDGRIATFRDQRDEIDGWAKAQIAAGKLGNLSVFPYSMPFAEAVLDSGVSATLATYLNLAELEAEPLLDRCDGFIALRPLAGGRLTMPDPPADDLVDPRAAAAYLGEMAELADDPARVGAAIRFGLLHPAVTTTVISANSADHIDLLLGAGGEVSPDRAAFETILSDLERLGRVNLPAQ